MSKTSEHRQDKHAALEELAQRMREPLLRYFQRRGVPRETADDCVQDVFVRLTSVDLATLTSAEAYIFTIASSVAIDRSRKLKARHEAAHDPIENFALPSGEASPARVFEDKEALMRLDAILDELPARTREIFLLNRLDGLSYTQLAARFGISMSTIEKQMTRALAHLRKRFSADD